jgi:transcriptional regulator with XRE-family HTH domain
MKFDRDKLVQETALKLRRLRQELGYNRTEMGEWLGVTRAAYNKYENGETFPFAQTLVRLGEAKNISLDWFILDKGPRLFEEKEKLDVLEKKLEELQKELEMEREKRKDLEQEKERAKQEKEGVEQEKEKTAAKMLELEQMNAALERLPGVKELLEHLVNIPLLYHELLSRFLRFKDDNRELVESSMNRDA